MYVVVVSCLFPGRFSTFLSNISSFCTRSHTSFSKAERWMGCCSPWN